VEATSAHAASVKSAAAETAASTTASERVIGNKARANENECGKTRENVPKHGSSSLVCLLFD
jgi:hypothetical protein